MSPAQTDRGGYTRREHTGPVEATHAEGLKIDGVWWSQSRRQPVDLSPYRVGDVVRVVASETADAERRFLLEIARVGPQRSAPAYVDDLPDDLDDDQAARQRRAERLECLRIAAGLFAGWWVKKSVDPDPALVERVADQLVAWLDQADH